MTTYVAMGSSTTALSDAELRSALHGAFLRLGTRRAVLAVPPDATRLHSRAGLLTRFTYD